MSKWIWVVLIFLAAVLALAAFFIIGRGSKAPGELSVLPKAQAHYYQDPSRNLSKIRLKVFYAVPSNRAESIYLGWQGLLEPVLTDAAAFHRVQTRGLSELKYDISPEPVILEHDNLFYDTENTNHGNPEALRRVTLELERRAQDFLSRHDGDEFLALAILYEGVGASGSDGAMILSRTFLSDMQYLSFRSALFYHEFGHTMGLPDLYDIETNQPTSDDIMGAGRRRPIIGNYLRADLLKDLGVITD